MSKQIKKNTSGPLPYFIRKGLWASKIAAWFFWIGFAVILLVAYGLRQLPFFFKFLITAGTAVVMFVAWGWSLLFLDCPNCKNSLRWLGRILDKVRYCPFCGHRFRDDD